MYAQLTIFDGPRSAELVAAADRAGRERIDPLLNAHPEIRQDLVARYILRQPDGGSAVIVITGTEASLDRAVELIMTSELLPGEDPAQAPAGMRTFESLLSDDTTPPQPDIDGSSLLQIIYTSGTESLPKGAMLTHDAVLWEYVSCIVEGEMSENDLIVHALPLYHCAQLDVFLGPGVYTGATSVITGKPTAENILGLLSTYKANSFFAPPSIWIAMLRSPAFESSDLSALSIGSYVCQARAARQTDQAVWAFVAPLVRNDVSGTDDSESADTPSAVDVDTATADYIRIATERLC